MKTTDARNYWLAEAQRYEREAAQCVTPGLMRSLLSTADEARAIAKLPSKDLLRLTYALQQLSTR